VTQEIKTAPFEEALDAFHDHLDACKRCREQPHNLCAVGLPLFEAAGRAAAEAATRATWPKGVTR
jgi:hypothetical protein